MDLENILTSINIFSALATAGLTCRTAYLLHDCYKMKKRLNLFQVSII
ncbi:MAG TPA: hypothetical protein VJ208_01450 [Candidatus Nanoarchaeia archaeon]|nr:hypothetical protein [Candidatus Nanoarchaeia archaeon]